MRFFKRRPARAEEDKAGATTQQIEEINSEVDAAVGGVSDDMAAVMEKLEGIAHEIHELKEVRARWIKKAKSNPGGTKASRGRTD